MQLAWLEDAWREFQESADPDELVAASNPVGTATAVLSVSGLFLFLAYAPTIRDLAGFSTVWYAIGLVFIGGALSITAFKQSCRGPLGTACTLFDNTFYSSALVLAAFSTRPAIGLPLAVIHGLMICSFPARWYGLSRLFAIVMLAPPLALSFIFRPDLPVALITATSLAMMLIYSQYTRAHREARRRQARLEEALGVVDKLVDESVQTALTSTLLTLGHFLHELRNYQTALSANLDYLDGEASLGEEARAAIDEAQDAQKRQAALLEDTIAALRGRSQSRRTAFLVADAIQEGAQSLKENTEIDTSGDLDFEVIGNPEHLKVISMNLIRNAVQAGATRLRCLIRVSRNDTFGEVILEDNGPGISESELSQLFRSFGASNKPGGSGLGLYLVRRHIELLGGSIRAENMASGGARFVMRLPGARRQSRIPASG